jgi:hypothetical protein
MSNRTWDKMTEDERRAFNNHLWDTSGQVDKEMINRYREQGISMYGSHPDYPGEVIEAAPDGCHFIVQRENDCFIRVHEVVINDRW